MGPHRDELGSNLHAALLRVSTAILTAGDPACVANEFLGDLEGLLGARRVAWIEVSGSLPRVRESRRRSGEADLDEELWRGLQAGEVRRVSPQRLARSARCLRQAVGALSLCAAPGLDAGLRFMWIESKSALRATDSELCLAAAAAAHVFALATRLGGQVAGEALKRRGVAALAMVHDLRHQLSLGLLCAQRVREADGSEAESSLAELDRALLKARAIAQVALGDSPSSADLISNTNLRELLQEEAQTVGRLGALEGRGEGCVAIALRCPRGLRVRAAESSLSRLIRNLLLNACKASSTGTRVLLSAERKENRVVVCIEDFGRGMDARRVEQLFTSDRTEAGGAGCGTLSILACVDELDAELEVESTVGKGTRVTLCLPEARPEVAKSRESGVLLVDGNRERRLRRAKLLQEHGVRVLHVARAAEALFELERVLPSRLLVERGLPGAQFEQLTARARELDTEVCVLDYRDSCEDIAG